MDWREVAELNFESRFESLSLLCLLSTLSVSSPSTSTFGGRTTMVNRFQISLFSAFSLLCRGCALAVLTLDNFEAFEPFELIDDDRDLDGSSFLLNNDLIIPLILVCSLARFDIVHDAEVDMLSVSAPLGGGNFSSDTLRAMLHLCVFST